MRKVKFIVLGITLLLTSISAQDLKFVSAEDGMAIPYLTIRFQTLDNDSIWQNLSSLEGTISLPQAAFPLVLSTSHINFKPLIDTLFGASSKTYTLQTAITELDEIIVTGQFAPQSVRNSVFRVQTIGRAEIANRGAMNLEQALQNRLNLRITQDLAIGSASIGLQGISSQNVKILVDGVPLVNRNGNGNAADLSQINLQQIDRIEIVEGPMAVNYGANALAGVINLITKKDFTHKTEINAFVQSETAGAEIGPNRGKHIQSVELNHQFNKQLSVLLHAQHNDFQGFQGNAERRTHEWNPKAQWIGSGLLKYENDNHSFFYRADGLNELIEDFGRVQSNFNAEGQFEPFALDETYESKRLTQQLQAEGKLPFLDRYNMFISYSDFKREKSRFAKNLVSLEETLTTAPGDQDTSTYRVWEIGGAGHLSPASALDIQIGYQVSLENVGGGRILANEQGINEYAIYSSMEWNPTQQLTIRPGARFTHNSAFGDQVIPALQVKQQLTGKTSLRLAYGKGFRAPSVRELYFEFVDSNHRIFGNPNLKPETSNHFGLNLLSEYSLGNSIVKADLNFFYNDIEDQIAIGTNPNDLTSATYVNINRFKTLGGALSQQLNIQQLTASIGVSYIGRYNQIRATDSSLEPFFFSPEFNSNLTYRLPKWQASINLFYKYTGRLQSYFIESDTAEEERVSIGEIEGYHWLDATINKSFGKQFELLAGVRNLFNVRQVNNTGASGGTHNAGSSVALAYGRSYFLKLSYNLNLK